jgi:hypothetical protein
MSQIKTSVKSIGEAISVCLNNNLTFVAYRLPNQTEQVLMVQKNPGAEKVDDLSNVTGLKGFLVAPFLQSEKNHTFIINPDFYFTGKIPGDQFDKISQLKHPVHEGPRCTARRLSRKFSARLDSAADPRELSSAHQSE